MDAVELTIETLIDGTYYDWIYMTSNFGGIYKPEGLEPWAVETNRWFVHYVAGTFALDISAKILDLGSGNGHFVRAWKDCGFQNVEGIEISKVAIDQSEETGIHHGTIVDMNMFQDGQFDLVFSASVMEHIPSVVVDKAIAECYRVGKYQAHLIGVEVGTDPTHVNIMSSHDWLEHFGKATKDPILVQPEPVFMESPVIMSAPADDAPRPFRRMFGIAKGEVE